MNEATGRKLIKLIFDTDRNVDQMNEAVDIIMADVLAEAVRGAELRQQAQLNGMRELITACMDKIDELQRKMEENSEKEKEPCKTPEEEKKAEGACKKCKKTAGEGKGVEGAAKRQQAFKISRICKSCGKEFKAGSNAALYCPDCKAQGRTASKDVSDFAKELAGMDPEEG